MNLARSSLKLFGAKVVTAVIQFVAIAFFARELGAAAMGVYFLFQALLVMLAIPADFGLRGAVQKRISEGDKQGSYLSTAIVLKLLPLAGISAVLLFATPYVDAYVGADVTLLLVVALATHESAQLSVAVLRGELRVGDTALLNVVRQGIWALVGGYLVIQGFGATGIIYGLIAGDVLKALLGWSLCSTLPDRPSTDFARSLFDYGRYGVVTSFGGYFYSWMDVVVLGLFLTNADVGAYEIAWRLTNVVIFFSKSIAATLLPQVSRWDAEGQQKKIESVIKQAITPSMLLVIPAFFGVLVFSRELLGLIFGPEFTVAWLVLIILMGDNVLQAVHVIYSRVLPGIDRPDLAASASIVAVIVNLVLNVLLVVQFGIVGAAVATATASTLGTLLHGYYLSKFVSLEFPISEIGWCFLSATVMAAVLTGVRTIVAIDTLPHLLAAIALGAGVYGAAVLGSSSLRTKLFAQARNVMPVG